jgi:hypothetical protein
VGLARINSVLKGYPKPVPEIRDVKALAGSWPSSEEDHRLQESVSTL